MEAIVEYVAANPGRLVADEARESKFGCTVAAHGYYKVT
jgi:cephalosporin hydroxylase